MKKRLSNKKIAIATGIVAVSFAAMAAAGTRYSIGVQNPGFKDYNCITEWYVVWILDRKAEPERGEIWSVDRVVDNGLDLKTPTLPTKYLAGMPGDLVTIAADDIYINGEPQNVDRHQIFDEPDFSLSVYEQEYRLGDQQYFMLGNTQYTLDSRFYGPVTEDQLVGAAKGVI